jgi:predicted nuclease of restriction endonuclease-like RecB superfamily
VTAFEPLSPRQLVEAYELAQAQAVLLRAVRVVAVVECAAPGAYRALFHKLKFLRLLYTLRPQPNGYRIEIDGPFSLFESGTKYGLQLALALPALRECDSWSLTADVRWGTARTPLRFSMMGRCERPVSAEPASVRLPDELAALVDGIAKLETPWRAECAQALLDLPGVGLCVPDLVFQHNETGQCVYLELLGYWSRDAVWRRVELVQQGLGEPILFAVGKHLRVSEEVLSDDLPGALYVYKRTMIPRAILDRIEALANVPR